MNPAKRILIVDDERQITRMLRMAMQSGGYNVSIAGDGAEALERFKSDHPDIVITDLAMPVMDGIELTRAIRLLAPTPIIVLSVRDTETMKVSALDEGADDYLTKPFSTPELLARVRAQLRRAPTASPDTSTHIEVGDFTIDTDTYYVLLRGDRLHLTPKEFTLLLLFARSPGRVLTHRTLARGIWGSTGDRSPESLRVLIGGLRKKIELTEEQRYIRNEPWVGYRFLPQGVDEL